LARAVRSRTTPPPARIPALVCRTSPSTCTTEGAGNRALSFG
jgi:hypothetical protein